MGKIRHFFRDRPTLVALLLAAALCLKVFVPAGYMPIAPQGGIVVALCSGTMPAGSTVTVTIPQKPGHQDHAPSMADHPCAYAPLGAAAVAADLAPMVLAALAFVFVGAIVRRPLALPAAPARIRPPSQAPPLSI